MNPTTPSLFFQQIKKRKPLLISWIIILFLFFMAIFAPLIANHKPLILYSNYPQYFEYHFDAWKITHQKYADSITQKTLLLQKKTKLSNQLKSLNHSLQALSQKQNSLQNQSDQLLTQFPNPKSKLQNIKTQQLDITIQKTKIISQKQSTQLQLSQYQYLLNQNAHQKLILNSLKNMKFFASESITQKINPIVHQYQKIFSQPHQPQSLKTLQILQKNIQNQLSPSKLQNHFPNQFIFPAFKDLSFLEIFLMLFFLFLITSWPLLKKIPYPTPWIMFYALLGTVLISSIFSLLNQNIQYPPTNYKNFFLNHPDHDQSSQNQFAIYPPIPFGFNENSIEERHQKPSILKYIPWNQSQEYGKHLLGTDSTGRDVLSRIIWGARISLSVGFVALSIYVFLGIILGALAGYFGGWIDILISRLIEIVICFPTFFLILTIIAFVGPGMINIMIIIGLTNWTGIARLTRSEFLRLRHLDFVITARVIGVSNAKIIFKHILPNALTPVFVSATFGLASTILLEAGLSFLGFGVTEPTPSWGQMISQGQSDVLNYWWLSLIPGFMIFLSVTTYNLLGDGIREAIDPSLKE